MKVAVGPLAPHRATCQHPTRIVLPPSEVQNPKQTKSIPVGSWKWKWKWRWRCQSAQYACKPTTTKTASSLASSPAGTPHANLASADSLAASKTAPFLALPAPNSSVSRTQLRDLLPFLKTSTSFDSLPLPLPTPKIPRKKNPPKPQLSPPPGKMTFSPARGLPNSTPSGNPGFCPATPSPHKTKKLLLLKLIFPTLLCILELINV